MNPCLLGYATDPMRECACSPATISRYQKHLSDPLLDRPATMEPAANVVFCRHTRHIYCSRLSYCNHRYDASLMHVSWMRHHDGCSMTI
jgi:magnesium chelatase subunit ChlI-like protein